MKNIESQDGLRSREYYQLMEPDELTPEVRWGRVVDLLAEMGLAPELKAEDQKAAGSGASE